MPEEAVIQVETDLTFLFSGNWRAPGTTFVKPTKESGLPLEYSPNVSAGIGSGELN